MQKLWYVSHGTIKWINLAVEQDSGDAYDEFGVWHMHGECVPQNYQEAIRLYHLAAEKGSNNAQGNLGKLYFLGDGVPQDYVIAHMWFNIANANRNDSRELFPNIYAELRRKAEQLMTPPKSPKLRNWQGDGWRRINEKSKNLIFGYG